MDPYVVALFASTLWPRRDSPKRAARLARKYQDGRVVFLPGWLRAENDADEVPGLFAVRKGDPMWWRPRGLGRSAIALTVEGVIDPPLANLTDERDPTTSRFWFAWGPEREPLIVRIDDPYGTEFLPLLEGHGSVISYEASFEPADEDDADDFGAVRVDDCLICGAPASWIHELRAGSNGSGARSRDQRRRRAGKGLPARQHREASDRPGLNSGGPHRPTSFRRRRCRGGVDVAGPALGRVRGGGPVGVDW